MTPTEQNHGAFIVADGKRIGHISLSGDPLTLTWAGNTFRFSWHSYLGPNFLKADGETSRKWPGPDSPWWVGFELWLKNGRQTRNGKCICKPRTTKAKA